MAFEDAQYGDIRATLAVSQDEARTGSIRVVNLPNGRSVTVTVPAGIRDGVEIRLPGQGEASGPGGKAGDLILRVSVIATNRFEGQRWSDNALPTQAMQQPFYPPATQAPTEYVASEYPPPATYYPRATAPETVGGNYSSFAAYQQTPVAPQSYPDYGGYPPYQGYSPLQQDVPPPLRQKRSGLVTFLVVLIVLVLIAGSGSLYYFGYYQPNRLQSAANATAQFQATGTALVAQATAKSVAAAQTQAQATAQAHQALYTQATGGIPTLDDSMSSQSGNQWEEFTSTVNGTCGFSGGSYHAVMPKATFFQPCFAKVPTFSNFALQVNMAIQGDEGGIIFRADEANNKYYLFTMSTSGAYNLYVYVSNKGSQAQTLMSGHSSLVLPVGQSNEITLVAQDSTFSFYINKQYLSSVTDSTYSAGMIGVFGESAQQVTDVAFTNIKVWAL
ncbi:MAG: DnaJ C-terminal domain-containing protein [Ktedonobacteraceae bacterium]